MIPRDENDRLLKAGSESFDYDAADNLTKAPGTTNAYDAASQLETGTGVTYTFSFGGSGSGAGQLSAPKGLAPDSEGGVWVADTGHNRIQRFDSKGEFVSQFGGSGSDKGQFSQPSAVAVDSEGNIWVADTGNYRVQKFSSAGKYLSQFGSQGEENGQFWSIEDLAIDAKGNVWTVDAGLGAFFAPRVQEFNSKGEFVRKFGSYGSENGQLKEPQGIDVDSEGDVWVADTNNNRVQEFYFFGFFKSKFGEEGSEEGQLAKPAGIDIDSKGDVWVADTGNDRVQRWLPVKATTYSYDQAGNLTAVERPEGGAPAIDESFAYDGGGLRASRTVAEATSYFTWDLSAGLPLLLDDDKASYIYGPDGLPIAQISEGTPTYYHHDQLGSTRLLTNSSGNSTATFTYTAYGALADSTGTQKTPLGYAGQYTDAQSGLQYLRARMYDPATGQFLTRDPIEALTRQPYAYVLDNPLNEVHHLR